MVHPAGANILNSKTKNALEGAIPEFTIEKFETEPYAMAGTIEDLYFSFTFVNRLASIAFALGPGDEVIYSAQHPYYGVDAHRLNDLELLQFLPYLIKTATIAPMEFCFAGYEVTLMRDSTGTLTVQRGSGAFYRAWGPTANEAFLAFSSSYRPWGDTCEFTASERSLILKVMALNPTPLNEDGRKFPTYTPSFVLH